MENYDLRSCFLPDLAGLHVRIYQFSQLLRDNMPAISAHLDDLQVDPVYVSQWWLSCFAVTAPLPMLFRMYDVLFAEGVSETLMRVALSLMRKNQTRLLACSELEDAMQLLLSRAFWDCYGYNADEFVNDFAGLSDVVDREKLALLEQAYHRDAQLAAPADANPSAARQTSDVTTAASRFLGRLATSISSGSTFSSRTVTASATLNSTPTTLQPAPSSKLSTATSPNNNTTTTATDPTAAAAAANNSNSNNDDNNTSSAVAATTAAANLSPGLVAAPRPMSHLRRSASKQSIASTLGSMEAHSTSTSSAASVLSSASTDATSISRDSAASDAPVVRRSATHPASFGSSSSQRGPAKTGSSDERYLNSQIEDLLTALSDLQRQQAQLADQLQREREEREEDRQAVRSLLTGLKQADIPASIPPPPPPPADVPEDGAQAAIPLTGLFVIVEERFGGGNSQDEAAKSLPTSETKTQLQEQLARAKEQLAHEIAKGQEKNRQQADLEQEISTLKDQLQDSRSHVRNMHQDKQRLEKQIHNMRARASAAETAAATTASPAAEGANTAADWLSRATGVGASPPAAAAAKGGLRELKLGRSRSTPSQVSTGPTGMSKRASTMTTHSLLPPAAAEPTSEHEALLLELVQAKTAEAMARQEADEAKQKLERLRKTIGVTTEATSTGGSPAVNAASTAASAAMGMFGRFTSAVSETAANKTASAPPAVSATPPAAAAPSPVPASAPATSVGGFFGWRRG